MVGGNSVYTLHSRYANYCSVDAMRWLITFTCPLAFTACLGKVYLSLVYGRPSVIPALEWRLPG